MQDLDLDEADRCPHCDAILRDPPQCCEAAEQAYWKGLIAQAKINVEARDKALAEEYGLDIGWES
jgi:hypothetical protein